MKADNSSNLGIGSWMNLIIKLRREKKEKKVLLIPRTFCELDAEITCAR